MTNIVYFILLQSINVVISTFKSVLTIRGTRIVAAIINAIAYSVNIVIVYLVSGNIPLLILIASTLITNLIGVYIGLTILEKLRKERLWRIQTTVATDKVKDFKKELLKNDVKFISYETTWDDFKVVDIFSKTREDSSLIKKIILKYNAKYTISSSSGTL
jgi:uncharacterized protein YebE (UPF0316 family)